MKNIKILWSFTKGNRIKYISAIISIGLSVAFTLIIPLITQIIIDSVIGTKEINAPFFIKSAFNFLGGRATLFENLWICGIIIVLLTIGRGAFLFLKGKWSAEASEDIAKNLREKLYNHIQHLDYAYHKNVDSGDLIQRSTSDVDTIRKFLAIQMVEIGRVIFMVSIAIYFMLGINTKMTLIAMCAMPLLVIFAFIFFKKVQKAFKVSDECEAALSTVIQENLNGVRVVRAFAKEKHEMIKFENANSEYRDKTYKLMVYLATYWGVSDLLCMLQIGLILITGTFFTLNGYITLGALVVFITYEYRLVWPLREFGRILTDLGKAIVAVERIQEILDIEIEKEEAEDIKPEIKGEVIFDNVTFSYPDEPSRTILKNISFRVKKGETIAITGKTGSGKSSLVHLLNRLYDYNNGKIILDKNELKNIEKKWIRQHVGIVLQEPFLFSKTIEENINFTNRWDEKLIHEAANIASIHDSILDFEKGYQTLVGEKGVTLSGGQKQRIAIARTIINNYPILIFDDSLSAVDTETDVAIRKSLKVRKKDVTTFIISQRISSIYDADRIVVIDKGEIKQIGTHIELINQEGIYKEICKTQDVNVKEVTA